MRAVSEQRGVRSFSKLQAASSKPQSDAAIDKGGRQAYGQKKWHSPAGGPSTTLLNIQQGYW